MIKPTIQTVAAALSLLLAYYVAGRLGLSLAFVNSSVTAVWAPTGIALAALLVWGYRVWPIILLGALLVNLENSGSPLASLMIALGNTFEALAGAYLVNRFAQGRHAFDTALGIARFTILAALAATAISASIGVAALFLNDLAPPSQLKAIWLTWWLGDATSALIITPLLLSWDKWLRRPRWRLLNAIEGLLLLLLTMALCMIVFGGTSPFGLDRYPLAFLTLLPITWAAIRFSQGQVSFLIVVLATFAIHGTLNGFGPFALHTPDLSLRLVQIFLAFVTLTGTTAAALVHERDRILRRLLQSEQRYRILTEKATDVIVVINEHSVITDINAAGEKMFGYRSDELLGMPLGQLMPERLRTAHHNGLRAYIATRHKKVPWTGVELPGRHHDGHEIPLEISFGEFIHKGQPNFVGILRDISARKHAEESQRWLATLVESSDDAIIGKTLDGIVLSWNSAAENIFGYRAAEMIGQPISMTAPPGNTDELTHILSTIRAGEHIRHHETERLCKDGTVIAVSLTVSPIKDASGQVVGASTIARDITERRRIDERMRHMAQHDALTGLPNRMLCYDRIEQALTHAQRNGNRLAVLFIDLDGFKPINDTAGHEVGDVVLRMVSTRLQHCLREGDTVARLGGDEFVICLTTVRNTSVVIAIAEKILKSLRAPMEVGDAQHHVTASIGISLYPQDGLDTKALLRAADAAMYRAKAEGRDRYQTSHNQS